MVVGIFLLNPRLDLIYWLYREIDLELCVNTESELSLRLHFSDRAIYR